MIDNPPLQYGWMHALGGGVTAVDPSPDLVARIEEDTIRHGAAPDSHNAHRLRWSCGHGYGWATFQWLPALSSVVDCDRVTIHSEGF